MPIIMVLAFFYLISQGCKPELNNNIDPKMLNCGISEKDLGNRKLVSSTATLLPGQFEVFNQDGEVVTDYEVTPKNCLVLPQISPASSVVHSNGTAARFSGAILEFRSCAQDCAVFPICGYFKTASVIKGPSLYAQVAGNARGLTAIFDAETGPQSIDISENSCLRIDASGNGTLRVSDAESNFIETTLQEILEESPRKDSLPILSLRGPLNADEIFCKKNSGSYKLSVGFCVPKDLRDYCQEFRMQYGKKELEEAFGTADCQRIWIDLNKSQRLAFGAMRLRSPKVFSNLPNLKSLNLSGNPELGTFRELVGTRNIEELIVSHANFDLSEIVLFPLLRTLVIGELKANWQVAPAFPQIKSLEISSYENFDPAILDKFPNLENLTIDKNSNPNAPLSVLASLKKLKKLKINIVRNVDYAIPTLLSLEELEINGSLDVFIGQLPGLRIAKVSDSSSITALTSSMALEELNLEVGLFENREAYTQLQDMAFPSVKKVKLTNLDSFDVLNAFPSVEQLDVSISKISSFNYQTKFDLAALRKLLKLKDLSLGYTEYQEQALPLEDIYWPNLLALKTNCPCTYSRLNLPKLQELTILSSPDKGLDLSTSSLPSLKNLIIDDWSETPPKLPLMNELLTLKIGILRSFDLLADVAPNLKSLTFCMDSQFSTHYIPKMVEKLSNHCSHFDADILRQFNNLKELSIVVPKTISNNSLSSIIKLETLKFESGWDDAIVSQLNNILNAETIVATSTEMGWGLPNSSVVFKGTKNLILDGLRIEDYSGVYRSRFPDLQSLNSTTIWRNRASRDLTEYSEWVNALSGLQIQYKNFTGTLSDEIWQGLNCSSPPEGTLLEKICSPSHFNSKTQRFEKFAWEYRPSPGMGGWDYDLF